MTPPTFGDHVEDCLLLGDGVPKGLEQLGVDAIGYQNAKFASLEAFGTTLHYAEGRRRFEVLAGWHRRVGGLRHGLETEFLGDGGGKRLLYVQEMRDHPLPDRGRLDLAELERQGRLDMTLFGRGLADVELPCLAVMVGKAFRAQTHLWAFLFGGKVTVALYRRLPRPFAEGVRLVVRTPDGIAHRHVAVLLEMLERTLGRVDG